MTENKRFQVHKVIGSFHEWSIEDIIDDKVVFRSIIHKYSADILCAKLNELSEQADAVRTELQLCEEENNELQKENEQLKQCLEEMSNTGSYWWFKEYKRMEKVNKQLKQQIKDLRIGILDSIHEAEEIQCSCNPCVVEECVKKVIE